MMNFIPKNDNFQSRDVNSPTTSQKVTLFIFPSNQIYLVSYTTPKHLKHEFSERYLASKFSKALDYKLLLA